MMFRAVQKEKEVEKMGSHGKTVPTQEKIEKREREREETRESKKRGNNGAVSSQSVLLRVLLTLSSVMSGVMGDPPAYCERLYRWLIVCSRKNAVCALRR